MHKAMGAALATLTATDRYSSGTQQWGRIFLHEIEDEEDLEFGSRLASD